MAKPKILDLIKAGTGIASVLTGGKVKSILEIVNGTINNADDPDNVEALKDLATCNDEQNQVLANHEKRLRAIEAKLGS